MSVCVCACVCASISIRVNLCVRFVRLVDAMHAFHFDFILISF